MKVKHIILLLVIYLLSGFTGAGAAEVGDINIHGFISQGYITTSDNNFMGNTEDGTFEFNEIGVNFAKEMTDDLRVGVQLFSRDLGNYGNNEITLDWAYGDYRWKDWLGVRVGKIKTPHGLYNETRDVDMLRNWIFLPQSVYPEIERDAALALMGVGIYGNAYLGAFGSISYQAMIGTQNIDANESLAQSLMGIFIFDPYVQAQEIDVDKKYALSLTYETPIAGLRIGGTLQYAEMNLVSDFAYPAGEGFYGEFGILSDAYGGKYLSELESKNYVVSAEYSWNNLMLVAEYSWSNRDLAIGNLNDYPVDVEIPNFATEDQDDMVPWAGYTAPGAPTPYETEGWYVGSTYRFTDWFELGGYYSEYYPNRNDKNGTTADALGRYVDPQYRAWNKDICLTARFDINEFWTVKLEGHKTEGVALLPLAENMDMESQHTFVKDWEMYTAKVTYSF